MNRILSLAIAFAIFSGGVWLLTQLPFVSYNSAGWMFMAGLGMAFLGVAWFCSDLIEARAKKDLGR